MARPPSEEESSVAESVEFATFLFQRFTYDTKENIHTHCLLYFLNQPASGTRTIPGKNTHGHFRAP